jgi:hypothetical protein
MTQEILEYLGRESTRERKMMAKERREGAECAMRKYRQLSICGMDVTK